MSSTGLLYLRLHALDRGRASDTTTTTTADSFANAHSIRLLHALPQCAGSTGLVLCAG